MTFGKLKAGQILFHSRSQHSFSTPVVKGLTRVNKRDEFRTGQYFAHSCPRNDLEILFLKIDLKNSKFF